jgi:regulator of sigma E protease
MMDALTGLLSSGAMTVLGFLFVLSVIVFIHELGHFLVARWCGVTVTTFSIGFGRELAGFDDRHGTRWRIAAIPLGGYVKFLDDTNAASAGAGRKLTPEEEAGAFHTKPVWQRAAVVAAGPMANFILAAVIYSLLNFTVGVRSNPAQIDEVVAGMPAQQAGLKSGDLITSIDGWSIEGFEDAMRIITASSGRALDIEVERDGKPLLFNVMPHTIEQKADLGVVMRLGDIGIRRVIPSRIGEVLPGSPAEGAGLLAGDNIVAIDGKPVASFEQIVEIVGPSAGRSLSVKIERDGIEREVSVIPGSAKITDAEGQTIERGRIGIAPVRPEPQPVAVGEALRLGVKETYANIVQTITGISDIIAGHQSADQVGGPLLMAEVSGKVVALGLEPLLRWTALISANIGLLNLLPIPVLDGGHLVFYAVEAIRRKPLSQRVQEIGFQVGLALVLMLVVFVNLNDLLRVGRRLFGG